MKINEVLFGIDEALRFTKASPYGFAGARDKSMKTAFLHPTSPQDLSHHNLYTGHSAGVGYAMDRDQDLQNVFNNSNVKGVGKQALIHAIKNGASTLDAFDGYLPALYKKHGFIVTGRMPFSDEHAPAGWDYAKYGRPDIVFMAYRGGPRKTIEQRIGTFAPYHSSQGKYYTSYEDAKRSQKAEAMRSRMM